MALYEELMDIDVISPIKDELERGFLDIGKDSKIRYTTPRVANVVSPWLEVGERERNCPLWLGFYLKKYGIISRHCFNCWKIAYRPRTLRQLFAIYDLQRSMDINAKCGIERRVKSGFKGSYAAFWYCPLAEGLEGARKLHRRVSLRVKDVIGTQANVILKRACTEMEDIVGPSNEWEYPEEQHKMEDLLDATFDMPILPNFTPGMIRTHTLLKWIRWAFERGDATVREYVDKFPESFGVVKTVSYHDVVPEIKVEEVECPDQDSKIIELPQTG